MLDQPLLQCMAVGSIPRPVGLSQQGKCSECSSAVWMAPSSVNLLLTLPGLKIVCQACGENLIAQNSEPVVFALAPGALQEAIAEHKKVGNN